MIMSTLPRMLFWLMLAIAVILVGLMVLAPLVEVESLPLRLFARDGMLRQTALASALALTATAWIFFRPATLPAADPKAKRSVPPPVIGA
jgi:hypothetical protein